MATFHVRSATVHDIGAVRSIYAHYVATSAATFEVEAPDLSEMESRYRAVCERGLPYLVAEIDGKIAGYASAVQFRPRPAYWFTVEDTVYVRQELAGQGIGRALLEQLIEACRKAGCRQMIAAIGGANSASVAMHARLGFRGAGTLYRVGFKLGSWHDLCFMQKEL